jgi:hypothetical protein
MKEKPEDKIYRIKQEVTKKFLKLAEFIKSLGFIYLELVLITGVSLAISIGSVQIDLRFKEPIAISLGIVWGVTLLLSLTFPILAVAYAIYVVFERRRKTESISVLLLSYCAIILVFSGFYYTISYIEDYNDCVNRFYSYEGEFARKNLDSSHVIAEPPSKRAFSGMNNRMWHLGKWNETEAEERNNIKSILQNDFDDVIYPRHEMKLPVFVDCLHFSILSMTLFGYGPITSLDWKVTLANCLQIITGTLLFTVVLSMIFSGWGLNEKTKPPDKFGG